MIYLITTVAVIHCVAALAVTSLCVMLMIDYANQSRKEKNEKSSVVL